MRSRRFALLSVLVALLAVAVLAAAAWLPFLSAGEASFSLPPVLPQGVPGLTADTTPPGVPYAFVNLTPGRVLGILRGIDAPTEWSQSVQTALYWGESGYQVQNHQLYRRGDMRRMETKEEDGSVRVQLYTAASLYRWTKGNVYYYSSPLPELDAGDIIGVPSLETLLQIPEEQIVSAEYLGGSRLRILTKELFYNGEYVVSLTDGRITAARYTDGENTLVYQSTSLLYRLEALEDALFMLPDETRPG